MSQYSSANTERVSDNAPVPPIVPLTSKDIGKLKLGQLPKGKQQLPADAFMSDGHRRLDLVISYNPIPVVNSDDLTAVDIHHENDVPLPPMSLIQRQFSVMHRNAVRNNRQDRITSLRRTFEIELRAAGLELEREDHENIGYLKIHAPFDALARQAEFEHLQMPIKLCDAPPPDAGLTNRFIQLMGINSNPFRLPDRLKIQEAEVFTDEFSRERLQEFVCYDKDSFFTAQQRTYLTWAIVANVHITLKNHSRRSSATTGYESENEDSEARTSKLSKLKRLICRTKSGRPKIKTVNIEYLINQSIVNEAFAVHDSDFNLIGSDYDVPLAEMPLRKYLSRTWARWSCWRYHQPLKQIRDYYGEKIAWYFAWLGFYTHLLIVPAAVGLGVFIYGIVTAPNGEMVRFYCDADKKSENRIVFCRDCPDVICPFLKAEELCMEATMARTIDNYATVAFSVFLLGVVITGIGLILNEVYHHKLAYRLWYTAYQDTQPPITSWLMSSLLASTICAVFIFVMGIVNKKMSYILTEFETHPTNEQFDKSYTYKMCLLQFINYYGALLYLAFHRGQWLPGPLDNIKYNSCPPVGCLLDVSIQMAIIMTIKQLLNTLFKVLLPMIRQIGACMRTFVNKVTAFDTNDDLNPATRLSLFDNYLDMTLQYGFVTMFAAAFPLAPVFALINNVVRLRLDAYNVLAQTKRFIPERTRGIGAWLDLLSGLSKIAVLTNALLIAITSGSMDRIIHHGYYETPNSSYAKFTLTPFNTSNWCLPDYFPGVANCSDLRLYHPNVVIETSAILSFTIVDWIDDNFNETNVNVNQSSSINDTSVGYSSVLQQLQLAAVPDKENWKLTGNESKAMIELDGRDDSAMISSSNNIMFWKDTPFYYGITGYNNSLTDPLHSYDILDDDTKIEVCYISEYLDPIEHYSKAWQHYAVLFSRLAFIIVFEHFILLCQEFLQYVIPDVPESIAIRLEREQFLQREWFKQRELGDKYKGVASNRLTDDGVLTDSSDEDEDGQDADADVPDLEAFCARLPNGTALQQAIIIHKLKDERQIEMQSIPTVSYITALQRQKQQATVTTSSVPSTAYRKPPFAGTELASRLHDWSTKHRFFADYIPTNQPVPDPFNQSS